MKKLPLFRLFLYSLLACCTIINFTLLVKEARAEYLDCATTYSSYCYRPIWNLCTNQCEGGNHGDCDYIVDVYNECNTMVCDTYWEWHCDDGYYDGYELCLDITLFCPLK